MRMVNLNHAGPFALIAGLSAVVYAGAVAGIGAAPHGETTRGAEVTTVAIVADRDNTLYEDFQGDTSNGAGDGLFIGRTAGNGQNLLRRALLYFDVAARIPSGATIEDAALQFNVTAIPPLAQPFPAALHRLTAGWGEAGSTGVGPGGVGAPAMAGDATWLHRFYMDELWQQPGGDFQSPASATIMVDQEGVYQFSAAAQLIDDVQLMLDQPQQNFGWVVLGSEAASGNARRLASREHADPALHPTLMVSYSGGITLPPPRAIPTLAPVGFALLLLALWGAAIVASSALPRWR